MARKCLNCEKGNLLHTARNVPYQYKGHSAVVPKVTGWHCPVCGDVEFDPGEGKRFSAAIKRIAAQIDSREAAELARIRKKLKLTQLQAARISGGGPNAFSRYERGIARPLPAVTNLFRLLDRHPELLNELES